MRSETEMLSLLTGVAAADERIRAAVLSGSRANPDCPKDRYQDYDICYYVRDPAPFYDNTAWVEAHFGLPSLLQKPELMGHPLLPPEGDGHFTWLMVFSDGNRVDLSVAALPYRETGEPAIALLDKDGCLPPLPADGRLYRVQPPTAALYRDVCNEFWWCLNNVAKGLARDELPYAMEMFDRPVRDMLKQMTDWYIGLLTDFSVSTGKMGKYYKRHLPPAVYARYLQTFAGGEPEALLRAVDAACALFRDLALEVAGRCGFPYDQAEEDGLRAYFAWTRNDA